MKILLLKAGRLKVGAVVKERADGRQECPLLRAFDGAEASMDAAVQRFLAMIELVSSRGLSALSSEQVHMIDKENRIYEFVSGRLRVPFFQAESGNVVICTHMFMKKQQKVPPAEAAATARWKSRFERADIVEWIEELA
ncbi:MAG: type II toxin-antitoxin system RelE/ParE family toxin [Burkholderiaceae bacterium]|nr:type II toxin-antitoxin system RelE/ParE family toxin [Burkholderiaceae bacterium]